MRLAPLVPFCLALACGPGERGGATDAGTADAATGAGTADAATGAGTADAAVATDAGLPGRCEGACRSLTLEARFGEARRGFDRAYFGVTGPGASASGEAELHVEVYAGGEDGCPREDSPTPARTVVARLPLLAGPVIEGPSDAASLSLLDFAGDLLAGPAPLARATRFAVRPRAAAVCLDCPAPRPEDVVAFELEADLEGGSLEGHVFATRCASLDTP
jgi:hypothetical protein